MTRWSSDGGQATVELVVLLPLVVGLALLVSQMLVVGRAREQAASGARAAAVAVLQGEDPVNAARAALPGRRARDIEVNVSGTRVTVAVRPRASLPGLDAALTPRVVAEVGDAS